MNEIYAWEKDETHGNFDYNNMESWKGKQLKFIFSFIDEFFSFSKNDTFKVLDVGCNAALNLKKFSVVYPNSKNEYTGFDLNDTALQLAKNNIPTGIFKKCNFHFENPLSDYPDNYFDLSFATWVFTHVPLQGAGRENVIKDTIRVSKRGIILDPSIKKECINEILPFQLQLKNKNDETNVVVIDDYKRYYPIVKEHSVNFDGNTTLFYWEKK